MITAFNYANANNIDIKEIEKDMYACMKEKNENRSCVLNCFYAHENDLSKEIHTKIIKDVFTKYSQSSDTLELARRCDFNYQVKQMHYQSELENIKNILTDKNLTTEEQIKQSMPFYYDIALHNSEIFIIDNSTKISNIDYDLLHLIEKDKDNNILSHLNNKQKKFEALDSLYKQAYTKYEEEQNKKIKKRR